MANTYNSVWEIKEAIKNEKLKTENILKSAEQWKLIGNDVTSDVSLLTTTGHEWKTRYECQHVYNQMLTKLIKRLRAEIRMLRYGAETDNLSEWDHKTVGEWRSHIKHLHVEKWSQKSLRRMYERQLDTESMEYYRVRDQLTQLTKDVKNCTDAWIKAQEKLDEEMLSFAELPRKKRALKPVAKILPFISRLQAKKGENYSQRYARSRNDRTAERSERSRERSGRMTERSERSRERSQRSRERIERSRDRRERSTERSGQSTERNERTIGIDTNERVVERNEDIEDGNVEMN